MTAFQMRSDSTHPLEPANRVIAKADAAGFELNDRAKWLLHHVVMHPTATHLDDDVAALFSRSLEQQVTGVLEIPKPELPLATMDWLPEHMLDEGATSYRYFLQDMQGEWRYIAGGGGDDLPVSSVSGAEITGRLQLAGGAYGYNNEDLRNWRFASRGSLPTLLQSGSMRGKEQLQDQTLAWGNESLRLYGLFNFPGSTVITAADNGAGSTDWIDKTVDQIVTDIGALIDACEDATNQVRHITRILIPRPVMRFLSRSRIVDATGSNGLTFFEFIAKVFTTGGNVPNGPDLPRPENPIEFVEARYMDGTNERSEKDGVPQLPVVNGKRTSSMFGYIHNNPEVVAKDVTPMTGGRFEAPQRRMLQTVVPGEAKWGGIRCPEPVTLVRMDGIWGDPAPIP